MDYAVETKMAASVRNHRQRLNAQQFDRIFIQEKELFDAEPSSTFQGSPQLVRRTKVTMNIGPVPVVVCLNIVTIVVDIEAKRASTTGQQCRSESVNLRRNKKYVNAGKERNDNEERRGGESWKELKKEAQVIER